MFDEFGELRILAAIDYEDSEKIKDLLSEFNENAKTFNTQMSFLLSSLSDKSQIIQNAQLEALGYLVQLDSWTERKETMDAQENALYKEKMAESARYNSKTYL